MAQQGISHNSTYRRLEASIIKHRQLTLAREYRGLSQSELADKIEGLSQPNLSKYEKGLGGLSDDILEKVISFLEFPHQFFCEKISNTIEHAHFRKKSSITKKDRLSFETNIKLIGFMVDKMTESIEWPDYTFSSFDVEDGFSPEYIAQYIRRKFGLIDTEPMDNLHSFLEMNGVVVVEFDPGSDKFDGVSFVSDSGTPVIVINELFPNDRKRFTLGHELGHLVMHIVNNPPISEYRDCEGEANKFASEFLMPEAGIKGALRNLKVSDLGGLKTYWLTSIASIIRRARDLGCIDQDRYTYLNIELSRRGWKTVEPFDVPIDKPKVFKTAFKMHQEELGYSDEDFTNGFHLPMDVINRYVGDSTFRNKLKLVI